MIRWRVRGGAGLPLRDVSCWIVGVAAMVDELVALTREECMFWSQKVISSHSRWRKRMRGIDYCSPGISYDVLSRYGGFTTKPT